MSPLVRRTQALRGQTPVYEVQGQHRQKLSVIAALALSPGRELPQLLFQAYPDSYIDQVKAAAFLEELLAQLPGPLVVVWDRGNMHRGPAIREVLTRHPRLSLESLPPYAPMLNPVEHLWNHLKYSELANFVPRSLLVLEVMARASLEVVQQDGTRLCSFYRSTELPVSELLALAS
jgi:transposase